MGKKKSINKIINYNTPLNNYFFFLGIFYSNNKNRKNVLSTVSETNKFPGTNSINLTFKIVNDDSLTHTIYKKKKKNYWDFVLPKLITFTLVMAKPEKNKTYLMPI